MNGPLAAFYRGEFLEKLHLESVWSFLQRLGAGRMAVPTMSLIFWWVGVKEHNWIVDGVA